MTRFGLISPVNLAASLGCAVGSIVVEGTQDALGDDIKPNPNAMRSLLLSMEGSIHGRIPEILGADEAERVDTVARFLNGTTDAEVNEILGLVVLAVARRSATD